MFDIGLQEVFVQFTEIVFRCCTSYIEIGCWPQGIDLVYGATEAQEVAKQLGLSGRKCVRG